MGYISTPNIKVEIYFLTKDEGGREGPCFNGYRTQFHVPEIEMSTSASHCFIGKEQVFPGELVLANLGLRSIHVFNEFLHVGKEFEIREGAKTVGKGKVLEIISLEEHFENN